jgi:hypothetical protein
MGQLRTSRFGHFHFFPPLVGPRARALGRNQPKNFSLPPGSVQPNEGRISLNPAFLSPTGRTQPKKVTSRHVAFVLSGPFWCPSSIETNNWLVVGEFHCGRRVRRQDCHPFEVSLPFTTSASAWLGGISAAGTGGRCPTTGVRSGGSSGGDSPSWTAEPKRRESPTALRGSPSRPFANMEHNTTQSLCAPGECPTVSTISGRTVDSRCHLPTHACLFVSFHEV